MANALTAVNLYIIYLDPALDRAGGSEDRLISDRCCMHFSHRPSRTRGNRWKGQPFCYASHALLKMRHSICFNILLYDDYDGECDGDGREMGQLAESDDGDGNQIKTLISSRDQG